MTDHARTVDEFVELIRPEIERQIDEQIAAEADHEFREVLMRCRGLLVSKTVSPPEAVARSTRPGSRTSSAGWLKLRPGCGRGWSRIESRPLTPFRSYSDLH
jgi:hypothetical protein